MDHSVHNSKRHLSPPVSLALLGIEHAFAGDSIPLFAGIDLTVATGQVVAIVGTSGVGKSTLFYIASGLLTPCVGKVLVEGIDRTGQAGFVGYMAQKDLLLPFKKVYDNIALPLLLQGQDKKSIADQVTRHLADFGLQALTGKYPHLLSGGQRQRAALLRTYLSNERLMLLDEPFSALDYVSKQEMYVWFKNWQKKHQLTCLIITHDIDEAMHLAQEVRVLAGFPARLSTPFIVPQNDDFRQSPNYFLLKQTILSAISG